MYDSVDLWQFPYNVPKNTLELNVADSMAEMAQIVGRVHNGEGTVLAARSFLRSVLVLLC